MIAEISDDNSNKLDPELTPQGYSLENILHQSGQLKDIDLLGINHVKRSSVQHYVAGIIQSQNLDQKKVQLLMKDIGNDIALTIYHEGAVYAQINYSQLPKLK